MLGVHMQTTIKTLFEKGHSKTQIGKILGIDRKTVRKILKNPDKNVHIQKKPHPSTLDPHTESSLKQVFLKNSQQSEYFRICKKRVLKVHTLQSEIMSESLKITL